MFYKSKILLAFLSILAVTSCVKENEVNNVRLQSTQDEISSMFIEGEAHVCLSDDIVKVLEDDGEVPGLLQLGLTPVERLFPYAGEYEERTRKAGLHRWYKVRLDKAVSLTKAIDTYEGTHGIEHFVPVRKYRQSSYFNDPRLQSQWHYNNLGGTGAFSAGADINIEAVWQNYTTGDSSVIVAVVDQGVDEEHEDLAANYAGGFNFITDGGRVTPDDHGTHVAGTIAAINNNGVGVAGIAGGDAMNGIKGVKILSCQIFSGNKSTGAGAQAIKWAADNGAIIANNSWGYTYEKMEDAKRDKIGEDLKAAIDYFIKYAGCDNDGNQLPDSPMKGGVVIFAAGNDAWEYNPIGEYEPVISVGAIAPDYSRAYYSCYGDWVDIAAPGGSAKVSSGQVISTLASNKYGEMQGTSMACPHVSGVAALIASYFGGPGFTADMLKEKLINGARKDVLPSNAKIGPLVDALGSITHGTTIAPDPISEYSLGIIGNKVSVSLNVTKDKDDVKPYRYIILISENPAALENLSHHASMEGTIEDGIWAKGFRTGLIQPGKRIDMTLDGLDFEKEYYLRLFAADYAGNVSSMTEVKQFVTGANNPPVIYALEDINNIVLKSHDSYQCTLNIYDPEGQELKVYTNGSMSGASLGVVSEGVWRFSISGRIANAGSYTGEIIAEDKHGAKASIPVSYRILPNSVPATVQDFGQIFSYTYGETYSFNLSEYFKDDDKETLTYKVIEGNKNVAKCHMENDILQITLTGYGLSSVSVTATDGKGASAKADIPIMVKAEENLVEIYPIPTATLLNVRTGETKLTTIEIETMSDKCIFSTTGNIGAFEPAVIDMTAFAPGRYRVRVTIDDLVHTRVITKL